MAIFSAIGAAVAAVSGWIGGLGAVGAFALKAAVGIGLSLAAQALSGKQKTQEQKFSINTGLSGGGALSRSFIMGRAATGGSLVWANTWGRSDGSNNAWLTQVIALSDMPVNGLAEVWVDGVQVTWDPARNNDTQYGMSIPQFENGGANLYVKFYDGTQTAADPTLVSTDSTPERPWQATRVGRGVAYVIVRARSTKGVFSGIPTFTFVVNGMKLYDPSRDSTQGGIGNQRYTDPSTWGGDGDYLPVVQIYNLLRGIKYGASQRWVYGFQNMSGARLPSANWIRQINKCRAPILESGGFQPTYRAGGQIDVNAPLSVALDELLTSCQGKISEAGGIYTIYVGVPDDPQFAITDEDIISTEEQEFTPFFGLADSINGISATYPEPIDGYSERTAPPMLRPDLEALDGNRRLMADVQFTFVPYSEQVQRLMKAALLSAMRYRRHTITLPPKFWRFAVPGETLRWTSVRNGYVDKLFTIDGVSDKANLDVTIDITEYDPDDYDWNSESEYQPPTAGSLGPIIPAPRPILDPFVEPYIIRGQNGEERRPAIRLVWDNAPEALIGVGGVEWEVRLANTTDPILTGSTSTPERGSVIVSAGVLPNTAYEVRMRYTPLEGYADHLWSGFLPVTSPNVLLGADDIYAPGIVEGIEQAIADSTEWLRDGTRQLILEQQRISRLAIDQDFGNYTVRQTIRREAAVTYESTKAAYNEAITVAVGPNSALALRFEQLEVYVNTTVATAIDSLQTQIDETGNALAEAITALSAADESGNTATANFRMTVNAGPSGYSSRIGMEARTGGAGSYRSAGLFIDVPADEETPSRLLLQADQVVMTNGVNTKNPFVFQGGELTLNAANIGLVNAGVITSSTGKMIININLGTIEIFS